MKFPDSNALHRALVVAHPRVASEIPLDGVLHGEVVSTLAEATARPTEPGVDLVIVTAELPDDDPREVLSRLRERLDAPSVLVVTQITDRQLALAHESSADATMTLPLDLSALSRMARRGRRPGAPLRDEPDPLDAPMVGETHRVRELWRRVLLASSGDASVLVLGETGSGKERVARALHRFSWRRHGPFVAVNCAALPEPLLESELFGHEKGAFTGAVTQRKGRFELADGGTLFLDEVGDLPRGLQAKLLRALEERRFERLGAMESVDVDVRIVAATHRDLDEEVERGSFRADLYFRLAVLSLRVPPLRDRRSDVLRLWEQLVAERAVHRSGPMSTSAAARRSLLRYRWPGNIRELQNAAQHAVTVAAGDRILPADLPESLAGHRARAETVNLAGLTLAEVERMAILQSHEALASTKATAEVLGISVRKLQYRLREYRQSGALRGDRAAGDPVGGRRLRTLLAEDDDELRWVLTDVLRGEGYDVVAVPDGNALLEHLGAAMLLEQRDAPPDVIVSDIRMPGMSGVRLLEAVRGRGWTTPVVVMSAFGDEETRRTVLELGAAAFLEKPLDVEELKRVITSAVVSSEPHAQDVHG